MQLNSILGQGEKQEKTKYVIKKIRLTDEAMLQRFADFYNESGQLSWKLTPQRVKQKLKSKGMIWLLMSGDEIAGSIALKHIKEDDGVDVGELGYVMVSPEHRSLKNIMSLFKEALRYSRRFDAVFITTQTKNKTVNKLLERTNKVDLMYKIRSQFSHNLLYVWSVRKGKGTREMRDQIVADHFRNDIIDSYVKEIKESVITETRQSRRYYKGDPLEAGGTSIAGSAAPPIKALFKSGFFTGKVVLDYGAGKYGRNADFLREHGIKVYAYDPFNGHAVDGWTGVSNKLPPYGNRFDIGFTSYVLNVVPEHVEDDIIAAVQKRSKHQIHITRNMDIFVSVKKALERGDPTIVGFYMKEYDPNYKVDDGVPSDEHIMEFVHHGVQTSRGFQRIPELEHKGFHIKRNTQGFKVYEK